MRTRLSYRSGNTALNKNTFKNLSRTSSNPLVSDQSMTIKGTVDKTAISLLLLVGKQLKKAGVNNLLFFPAIYLIINFSVLVLPFWWTDIR